MFKNSRLYPLGPNAITLTLKYEKDLCSSTFCESFYVYVSLGPTDQHQFFLTVDMFSVLVNLSYHSWANVSDAVEVFQRIQQCTPKKQSEDLNHGPVLQMLQS